MSLKSTARKNARRGLTSIGQGVIILNADNKRVATPTPKYGRGFSQPYTY